MKNKRKKDGLINEWINGWNEILWVLWVINNFMNEWNEERNCNRKEVGLKETKSV